MNIGSYVREKRLQKGMTQEELADKCELTVRTIQRIESGEVDPRTYTLHAIAAALDIDYSELFHGDAPTTMMEGRSSLGSFWLAILHLSGVLLLVFPPLIIWALNKDRVADLRQHAVASINFQLSMLIYISISALLIVVVIGIPMLVFLGIYVSIIVIINTAKVLADESYSYPLSIKFLKP